MKRLITFSIGIIAAISAMCQTLVTLHSECYSQYGDGAMITLGLGSTAAGTITVTAGGTTRECEISPATYNAETQSIEATYISCQPGVDGLVEISAVSSIDIDYFNGDGCAIRDIEFAHPTAIDVLSLRHNNLGAIDLSAMTQISSIDLGDNPFDVSAAIIGPNKPRLTILTLDMVGNLDPAFSLTSYPSLVVFEAYGTRSLTQCDPTQCPYLMKLTIDGTSVETLDVSSNPVLVILNVSESGISELDLSNCANLQELYCDHRSSSINTTADFTTLDVTHCPDLKYLFCSGNKLTNLDLSQNSKLQDLYCRDNQLTKLDLSHNPALLNVMVTDNNMNFNTLPINPGTWMEYECRQRPLPVPQSYLIGSTIDLANAVVRSDTPTYASVFSIDPNDPSMVTEIDASAYTYVNGTITINQEIADSVYVSFYNPTFPDIELRTTTFKVKDAEQFGKDDLAFTLNIPMVGTSDRIKLWIGMNGASEEMPKTFYVDMGNGEKHAFSTTTATLPDTPNVNVAKGTNGLVTVYVPESEKITAIGYADSYVANIDLSNLEGLRELSLTGTEMYDIDLSRNRGLEKLTMTGNHFGSSLTLAGVNGAFEKYKLTDIDLSNNEMTAVGINTMEIIEKLDLSHNGLTTIDFTDAELITDLDLSDNDFETLKLNYLSSLKRLNVNGNQLSQIIMPETNVIEWMDVRDNRFTFANIPPRGHIAESNYLYTPQAAIPIPAKGPGCNLAEQYVTINGQTTQFEWYTTDGIALTDGIDYTITDGKTTFLTPSIGKTLYCIITNAAYPAFAGENSLRTTDITALGMPEYVIGEFTTLESRTADLSFASTTPNNSIYIDWGGDGMLEEYLLETTYKLFKAQTTMDAHVKVYSYDAVNNLSVFSISAGRLADVDLTEMRQLICLNLTNAGLSELEMPQSPTLSELYLDGGNFTQFDFAAWPSLQFVSFQGNLFETADLTGLTALQNISFAYNQLTSITFGGNTNLWGIYLSNNQLENIDLSGAPAAYQVALNYNKLSSLDVDGLTQLRVLYIDHNNFDFNTLPRPRDQWVLYVYNDQTPIEVTPTNGVVDLSSQAFVDNTPTIYTWISGEPWYDSELDAYLADVLVEGEDYEISDGVTRFLTDWEDVSCLMTNDVYPSIVLTTNMFDIELGKTPSISTTEMQATANGRSVYVTTSPNEAVMVYDTTGRLTGMGKADSHGFCIINGLPTGIAIVKSSDNTIKLNIR